MIEFESPGDGREVVTTVRVNGFEDVNTEVANPSLFVEETFDWDGVTTLVVDMTEAEQPCRGAVFTDDGNNEAALGDWMGSVHRIEVDGGTAVVSVVGCRQGTVTAE